MRALVLAAVLQATAASATAAPSPTAGAPVAEVTVTGRREAPAATVAERADEVQAATSVAADRQMARWYDRYCPRVGGLATSQGERMAQAMRADAAAVGLKLGAADCVPNVLVLVSDDPNATLDLLLKRNARVFGDERAARIREVLGGEAAVRWYVAAQEKAHDGMPLGIGTFRNRASHITESDRFDFAAVIILADARRVGGLPLATLADYLAMVSLAQVKRPAAPHPETVLDLFPDGGGPAPTTVRGLTAWDRSYLRGLYALDPATSAHAQRWGIARELADGPAPPPPTPATESTVKR